MVAYVLRKVNMKENKYENTVVIEDLSTGKRRYVEDASMPKFSPDGKKMLYLRVDEEKKKSDLYLLELETMISKRLVEAKNIKGVDWHRDSRKILILISKKLEDEDLYFDSEVPVWFNGEGFRDSEKFIFSIYDTEGEVEIDRFEDEYVENAFWHGSSIIYSKRRVKKLFQYYDIVEWKGKKRTILENVPYYVVDTNGKQILLHGRKNRKYLTEHSYLYIYDGDIKEINEKYGLESMTGKIDDEGNVYSLTLNAGNVVLEKYDGKGREIVSDEGYIYSFSVSSGKIAFLKMSDVELGELYIFDGKVRKITSYNAEILKKLKPKRHRHFRFRSYDGKEIDAWYIKPSKRGKRPLIVFVHGGPKGMYGHYFHYNAQLMASRGYYVLFVNPRGSEGYSEEFALEVIGNTGIGDFKDIMKGIDAPKDMEDIDESRIGITGISYGGYMTNWAITQSDRFKAAISEQGISYWFTSYAFSDVGLWYDKEIIGEDPLNNENYRKLSPIFYVDNVKTPVLFIHSLEDYRCPLDQSMMFYNLLRERGKEAYLVVFKEGEHGHSVRGKPRARLKRYRIFVEFFEKKMNDKEFKIEEVLK
jgi:dipeptidyl aminopeptidase/acylaminoacyl peptidase